MKRNRTWEKYFTYDGRLNKINFLKTAFSNLGGDVERCRRSDDGKTVFLKCINALLSEFRSPWPSAHYQELNPMTSDTSDLSIHIFFNGTE